MSVKIGNNNKIGDNNAIGDNASVKTKKKDNNTSWASRHPIIIGIFCSIVAGIILLFSFWSNIIKYIESLFK